MNVCLNNEFIYWSYRLRVDRSWRHCDRNTELSRTNSRSDDLYAYVRIITIMQRTTSGHVTNGEGQRGQLPGRSKTASPVFLTKIGKGTRLPSVGFQSWSRFLAVSLQVMWVINRAVGCHYFPPGLQLPPQRLRGLLPILLLGEQRHYGCEQFA